MSIKESIKNSIPDKIYLKYRFKKVFGEKLNLKNPQTFNEKLQWLKLYDRKPIYTTMVDKYEAKKYVASLIGNQYIIPTIGVWDNFESINFDSLPNQFVLKTTHDSGGVVIIKNKELFLNDSKKFLAAKEKLQKSLKRNFYYVGREWPYKNVKPRILAEKFMANESDSNKALTDYKIFCFNGQVDSIMTCSGREKGHPEFRFYDQDWKRLSYQWPELEPKGEVEKPSNLNKMLIIAHKLSSRFPHIRVDLYDINNNIYFGELTFFDQSGFDTDITKDTDMHWGKMIDLDLVMERKR